MQAGVLQHRSYCAEGGGNIAKFFLVDNEPMLITLYRDLLELQGHDVVGEALNGQECLDKVTRMGKVPEYILMDYRMKPKDGIQATRALLELNPDFKINLITADQTMKEEALALGAKGFLAKPFEIRKFMSLFE